MGSASLVSPQEYLTTTYRPDRELVDGLLLERNVGQRDHSRIQSRIVNWFCERWKILGLEPFVEHRVRVAPNRFRIPDVCAVAVPVPDEPVLTRPPYICIEVLSPEDTFPKLQDRFDDYLNMGVENVWVVDPISRRAWTIARQGHFEALDGVLRTNDARVALPLSDLFVEYR